MKEPEPFTFDIFLKTLRTTEDATLLTNEMESILQAIYKSSDQTISDVLKKVIRASTLSMLTTTINAQGSEKLDQQEVKKYADGLIAEIKKAKLLKLSLAFSPTDETLDLLHAWTKHASKELILLNITTNTHILGGVIVSYEGYYQDISLESKLEKELQDKPELLKW